MTRNLKFRVDRRWPDYHGFASLPFAGSVHGSKDCCLLNVYLGSARASSLQPSRIAPLLLAGVVALSIGAAGHSYFHESVLLPVMSREVVTAAAPVVAQIAESEPVRVAVTAANEVHKEVREIAQAVQVKPENVTREVEIGRGESLVDVLTNADVDPDDALAAAAAMNKVYDHEKLKAGQELTLSFTRLGSQETLTGFTFLPESTKEVTIARAQDGSFAGRVVNTPIERQRFAVRATIRGSLFETGRHEGIPQAVMAALLRAYAHAVDFQRDIHSGDKFEVLYDQPVAKDGKPVGQGVIIYAALEIAGKIKPLYRVTFADGAVDYFDERGQSVKRALLRTPVSGAHVTSGFGMRMHPLLGYSKMHKGVDFGAAIGTPIFAAGSGTVEESGFKGAYGRFVLLRHGNRVETAYAHMSRFARGVYPGAHVNQGDVIGFVGTSGRSTGPHLHFEVRVAGRQVNPLSINMPTGRVLQGRLLAQFREGQAKIKREFASLVDKDSGTSLADSGADSGVDSGAESDGAAAASSGMMKASAQGASPFAEPNPVKSCGLRGGC